MPAAINVVGITFTEIHRVCLFTIQAVSSNCQRCLSELEIDCNAGTNHPTIYSSQKIGWQDYKVECNATHYEGLVRWRALPLGRALTRICVILKEMQEVGEGEVLGSDRSFSESAESAGFHA